MSKQLSALVVVIGCLLAATALATQRMVVAEMHTNTS